MISKERRNELVAKGVRGELTLEDCREIVAGLREERVSAGYASRGAKKKKGEKKEAEREEMERDIFAGLHDEEEKEDDDE